MPSVVLRARDAEGRDRADVRVTMDSRLLAPLLDGRAIDVDPGEHKFVFEAQNAPLVEVHVVVLEGVRSREISATVGTAPRPKVETAAAAPQSGPVPVLTYVFGGVALAALGTGVFFGASGLSDRSGLSECAPNCPNDRMTPIQTKFLVADISYAVALVASVAGMYFLLTRATVDKTTSSR